MTLLSRIPIPVAQTPDRRTRIRVLVLPGLLLLLFLPLQTRAQNVRVLAPAGPDQERAAVFQLGIGFTVPLHHLAAADDPLVMDDNYRITHVGDGYARPGTSLCLRVYYPISRRIDLAADISLPRFKLDQAEFRSDSSIHITDPDYYGRALSLGARYIALERNWGRAFLLLTGGMYQLNLERFLSGPEIKTRGAYRPGAAIGGGIEYSAWLLVMDLTVRYHRYTDFTHFGSGDLAWLEVGYQVSFDLDGKD